MDANYVLMQFIFISAKIDLVMNRMRSRFDKISQRNLICLCLNFILKYYKKIKQNCSVCINFDIYNHCLVGSLTDSIKHIIECVEVFLLYYEHTYVL